MKSFSNLLMLLLSSVLIISIFSGCGALSTAIEKRNLEVQTKMSNSIFLEPVSPEEQIVYIRIRNTSDKDIDIEQRIKESFEKNGFVVTRNPKEANFMIQANVLQVGKSNANGANSAFNSGFGGAVLGVGIAGATGASSSKSYATGGIIGAVAGTVSDALVKDVYFTMITDVEIRQRASVDEIITQTSEADSKQGISNNSTQIIEHTNAKWKIYRTRVVSVANQVNLEFEETKPKLIQGLIKSLSGLI